MKTRSKPCAAAISALILTLAGQSGWTQALTIQVKRRGAEAQTNVLQEAVDIVEQSVKPATNRLKNEAAAGAGKSVEAGWPNAPKDWQRAGTYIPKMLLDALEKYSDKEEYLDKMGKKFVEQWRRIDPPVATFVDRLGRLVEVVGSKTGAYPEFREALKKQLTRVRDLALASKAPGEFLDKVDDLIASLELVGKRSMPRP